VLDGAHTQDGLEQPVWEGELFKQPPLEFDAQPRQAGRFSDPLGQAEVLGVGVAADDLKTSRREQERQERQPRPCVEQTAALRRNVRPRVRVFPLTAEVAERVGRDRELVLPDTPGRREELDLEALERGEDVRVARVLEIGESRIAVACEQALYARRDKTSQVGDRPFRPAA